jgi:hypothetical protein
MIERNLIVIDDKEVSITKHEDNKVMLMIQDGNGDLKWFSCQQIILDKEDMIYLLDRLNTFTNED